MEKKRVKEIIIDTYALLAIVYDEVSGKAKRILEEIHRGSIRGLIPVTVVYEYVIHWMKGRIPGLKSLDEVITYLKSYFKIVNLGFDDYVQAAIIKTRGDRILKKAEDKELRTRRLSIVDSTVIVLARKRSAPILTGDKDLTYIARKENVEVIW